MENSFFGSLFDFSFDSFITPKIVMILYGIMLVITALGSISFAFSGFTAWDGGFIMGIGTLILSPFVFLLGAIFSRVYCEVIVALVKIAQNTSPEDVT